MMEWYVHGASADMAALIQMSYRYAREIEHSDANLNALDDYFGTERIHITYQSAEPVYCCPVQRSFCMSEHRFEYENARTCLCRTMRGLPTLREEAERGRAEGRKWREKYFEEI